MPHITVEMLPGRTPEVKKAIAKEVMERVAPLAPAKRHLPPRKRLWRQ